MRAIKELEEKIQVHAAEAAAAKKLLEAAQAKKSSEAQWHLNVGMANYALRDYETAAKHLEISYDLDEEADTAARLALAEWRLGDLTAAQRWIRRALALDPKGTVKSQVAGTNSSYLAILSTILLAEGEIDAVEKASSAALDLNKNDPAALYALATAKLARGDGKEATELLSRAAKNAPGEFLSSRITKQIEATNGLLRAGVAFQPHTVEIADISRIIV